MIPRTIELWILSADRAGNPSAWLWGFSGGRGGQNPYPGRALVVVPTEPGQREIEEAGLPDGMTLLDVRAGLVVLDAKSNIRALLRCLHLPKIPS
jgi:hypothetical protein